MTLAEVAQTLGEQEWRVLRLEQENARLQQQVTALSTPPRQPGNTTGGPALAQLDDHRTS